MFMINSLAKSTWSSGGSDLQLCGVVMRVGQGTTLVGGKSAEADKEKNVDQKKDNRNSENGIEVDSKPNTLGKALDELKD
jgi:hypothetical protein